MAIDGCVEVLRYIHSRWVCSVAPSVPIFGGCLSTEKNDYSIFNGTGKYHHTIDLGMTFSSGCLTELSVDTSSYRKTLYLL